MIDFSRVIRGAVLAMTSGIVVLGVGCSGPGQSAAAPAPSPVGSTGKWTFDTDPVGGLPPGAQSFSGQWAVRAEPDSPSPPNALCQTGNADYPAIGLDRKSYTDLILVTHFKPISGKTDQAGGLIFRVVDGTDDRYKSGGIGLWTKSDSVTCFDDVEVTPG